MTQPCADNQPLFTEGCVTTKDRIMIIARLIHLAVSAASLMLTAYLVPGFRVGNFGSALITALVIGIVNALLKPILILLTLPLNILTLGLFTFVINGLLLKLCAHFLPNFFIDGLGTAIIGSIILTLVSAALNFILFG